MRTLANSLASFRSGLATAGAAVLLYLLIALVDAAVYVWAGRLLPAPKTSPWFFGPLYGIAALFLMSYGVLPLSPLASAQFSLGMSFNGGIGHTVLVGLSIAFCAGRAA